jgi:hippurate hydrolase
MHIQRTAALPWLALAALFLGATGTRSESPEVQQRVSDIRRILGEEYSSLEALYKHLHSHPELSLHEVQTAARLARELKAIGFEVHEKVGGTGVVGIFRNGKGPTVLVRTDMDALPVIEQTGLGYGSKVRVRDKNDREVGVMHACGHDMQIIKPIL